MAVRVRESFHHIWFTVLTVATQITLETVITLAQSRRIVKPKFCWMDRVYVLESSFQFENLICRYGNHICTLQSARGATGV